MDSSRVWQGHAKASVGTSVLHLTAQLAITGPWDPARGTCQESRRLKRTGEMGCSRQQLHRTPSPRGTGLHCKYAHTESAVAVFTQRPAGWPSIIPVLQRACWSVSNVRAKLSRLPCEHFV